jgi:hypothetical protein
MEIVSMTIWLQDEVPWLHCNSWGLWELRATRHVHLHDRIIHYLCMHHFPPHLHPCWCRVCPVDVLVDVLSCFSGLPSLSSARCPKSGLVLPGGYACQSPALPSPWMEWA